jgi:hypothetical protein
MLFYFRTSLAIGSRMLMHVSEPYLMLPLFFSKLYEASRVVQKTCGGLPRFETTSTIIQHFSSREMIKCSFRRRHQLMANSPRSSPTTGDQLLGQGTGLFTPSPTRMSSLLVLYLGNLSLLPGTSLRTCGNRTCMHTRFRC